MDRNLKQNLISPEIASFITQMTHEKASHRCSFEDLFGKIRISNQSSFEEIHLQNKMNMRNSLNFQQVFMEAQLVNDLEQSDATSLASLLLEENYYYQPTLQVDSLPNLEQKMISLNSQECKSKSALDLMDSNYKKVKQEKVEIEKQASLTKKIDLNTSYSEYIRFKSITQQNQINLTTGFMLTTNLEQNATNV